MTRTIRDEAREKAFFEAAALYEKSTLESLRTLVWQAALSPWKSLNVNEAWYDTKVGKYYHYNLYYHPAGKGLEVDLVRPWPAFYVYSSDAEMLRTSLYLAVASAWGQVSVAWNEANGCYIIDAEEPLI